MPGDFIPSTAVPCPATQEVSMRTIHKIGIGVLVGVFFAPALRQGTLQ